MPQINSIKQMARDGQSVAAIARTMQVDEKTVRKYLKQEDFSPQLPEPSRRAPKLDAHKPLID
jgi:transposase